LLFQARAGFWMALCGSDRMLQHLPVSRVIFVLFLLILPILGQAR
jgi:hypothetical protein